MAMGLMDPVAAPRDESMSGGASTRGFWTKRKRSAASLLTVMALLAGIAVAFKLFEREVPNNVVRDASAFAFEITAQDLAAGENNFRPVTGNDDEVIFRRTLASPACGSTATSEECQVSTFPGDNRRTDVRIKNTQAPAHSASWEVHVDQPSITVHRYVQATNSYVLVSPTGAALIPGTNITEATAWTRYVNYWSMRVQKQTYFSVPVVGEYVNNPTNNMSYGTACASSGLRELTSQNPCKLGQIRGAGSQGASLGPTFPSRPADIRQYRFFMEEEDDGTDQSLFKGWRITFSLVFTARVPQESESGRTSVTPVP